MRTKQQSSQRRVPCASTLIALAVVVLFGCSQKALAQQQNLTRTLPTTVNSEVDIGDFAFTVGGGSLWISVTVPSTGYSVAKQYLLPVQWNQSGNIWQTALPASSTGPFNGNDFALDIKVNLGTASLRLRTTASSGSVGTAYIVIKQEGANDTFTASTTSSAVSAPTTFFGSTALTQVGGNVGIGTTNPFSPAGFERVVHLRHSSSASYVVDAGGVYRAEFGVSSNGGWVAAYDGPLRFWTPGSEKMRIDSSGNVGIGFTNPLYKLHVNGTISATGLMVNGTPITGSASDLLSGTLPDARFPTTLPQVSGVNLTNLSASNLIGTVPTARLGSGTADASTFLRGDNTWAVPSGGSQWTNGSNSISYSGGNVGIGTTAPETNLHVIATVHSGTPAAIFQKNGGTGDIIELRNTLGGKVAAFDALQGRLSVGSSANAPTNNTMLHVVGPTHSNDITAVIQAAGGSGTGDIMQWRDGNGNTVGVTTKTGNFGMGTTAPSYRLDVQGGQINSSGGLCIAGDCKTAWSQVGGSQWTTSGSTINYSAGNVGIGTTPTPTSQYKLDVNGAINVTGNLNATGTITGGNIVAKYQDVAEWVPSSEQIPTGTVVVLDSTKSHQVISSTQAYDTRVAGVISEQPGIALGESGTGKVLVATTGRVMVQVDATNGPIHIGDLLVTSDVPGVAMKSEPIKVGGRLMHMPGTLIGKALEPLERGSGKILVLLSLQ